MHLPANLGDRANGSPPETARVCALRVVALFNPTVRAIAIDLGVIKKVSSGKDRTMLGWHTRSIE